MLHWHYTCLPSRDYFMNYSWTSSPHAVLSRGGLMLYGFYGIIRVRKVWSFYGRAVGSGENVISQQWANALYVAIIFCHKVFRITCSVFIFLLQSNRERSLVFRYIAFAELQTEVSDITSDLGTVGVPYWDYYTYSMKVLFPADRDYQLLQHSASAVSIVLAWL